MTSSKQPKKQPKKKRTKVKRSPIKPGVRFDVLTRAKYSCEICGASPSPPSKDRVRLEIDHKLPVSLGGTNDPSNLQVLCRACNRGKAAKLVKPLKAVAKKRSLVAKVAEATKPKKSPKKK